jgi:hypothetical protein
MLNKTGETHKNNKSLHQTEYDNSHSPPHARKTRNNNNFVPKPPLPNGASNRYEDKPKTDYLKERRIKREQNLEKIEREVWLKSLNNKKLSKKEKFLKIKEKAREIEELALRKEQLLNVKNGPGAEGSGAAGTTS